LERLEAPTLEFQNAAKFARLEAGVEKFFEALPKDSRLKWPGPATVSAPLALTFPAQGSILFETGKTGGDEAVWRDQQHHFPAARHHAARQAELHDF